MALVSHLEKLSIFEAVVRAGSIRKAAVQLRMTQPAVSRSVASLEQALECSLFTRSGSGVILTEQGAELFTFAEKLLKEAAETEYRIQHGSSDVDSSLVVGTYESIAIYFFPSFLKHVARTQRNLRLSLRTASSRQLMRDLKSGRVDLIVSVNPDPSRMVASFELYRDRYGHYASPDRRARNDMLVLLPHAQDLSGKSLAEYAAELNVPHEKTIQCENFETVRALVESGVGSGFLPCRVAEPSLRKGLLEAAGNAGPFGEHRIALSCLRKREGDRAIQWVLRELSRFLSGAAGNG